MNEFRYTGRFREGPYHGPWMQAPNRYEGVGPDKSRAHGLSCPQLYAEDADCTCGTTPPGEGEDPKGPEGPATWPATASE